MPHERQIVGTMPKLHSGAQVADARKPICLRNKRLQAKMSDLFDNGKFEGLEDEFGEKFVRNLGLNSEKSLDLGNFN